MSQNGFLAINEIFFSIQGESTRAGLPCIFVRLQGCPLRCSWCDTEYAFHEGKKMSLDEIIESVKAFPCKLIELTGGEPLAQEGCIALLERLEAEGFELLLETSGALSVERVPDSVKIVMDVKAPGSGEAKKNMWSNLERLKPGIDEVKFVVKDLADFEYAIQVCLDNKLLGRFEVLISPVHGALEPALVAEWIKDSGLTMRLQLQLHKYLWGPKTRGV
ncbi:radical SAM protein [bacterium]|nr:radical SAM protein [bacterium]